MLRVSDEQAEAILHLSVNEPYAWKVFMGLMEAEARREVRFAQSVTKDGALQNQHLGRWGAFDDILQLKESAENARDQRRG